VQFSMIFEAQLANPTREREHQTILDCLEQAVYAEDDDNIAGLEKRREAVKTKLHEADIPYKPNSSNAWDVNHAYGDPDRAIAYVERLQDAGADEIMCLIQMGLVPQEVCMETIRHWGETVIPHFRNK
jgi:hypothetical protein